MRSAGRFTAALAVALLVAAAPRPSAADPCADPCQPQLLPPPTSPSSVDAWSVIADIFTGMGSVLADSGAKFAEETAFALANTGFGALVPIINDFIPKTSPTASLQYNLETDLVKIQDYLACEMHSIVGDAVKQLTAQMDSNSLNNFNANVDSVLNWMTLKTCAWNCLNYTTVRPSLRNCVSGNNCVKNTTDPLCASLANQTWVYNSPRVCQNNPNGECDAGYCWTTQTSFDDVTADLETLIENVFIKADGSASVMRNSDGDPSSEADFTDINDLLSLVAYGKSVFLKIILLQTNIMYGAADGSNSVLATFAGQALQELQERYDFYTNVTNVRRFLYLYSSSPGEAQQYFDARNNLPVVQNGYAWGNSSNPGGNLDIADFLPGTPHYALCWHTDDNDDAADCQSWVEFPSYDNFATMQAWLSGCPVSKFYNWGTPNQPQLPNIPSFPWLIYDGGILFWYTTDEFAAPATYLDYGIRAGCQNTIASGRINPNNFPLPNGNLPGMWYGQTSSWVCPSVVNCWWAWQDCFSQFKTTYAPLLFHGAPGYTGANSVIQPIVDAAMTDLSTKINNTLAPVLVTIQLLQNLTNGLPVSAFQYYLNNYVPYASACNVTKDNSCTQQIPGPPKPASTQPGPQPGAFKACKAAPYATLCPGARCGALGCKSCASSSQVLVPNPDRWFWTCATCRAAGLGCPNSACSPQGCTQCRPGQFLAPRGHPAATTHALHRPNPPSVSYATCVNCADRYGAGCLQCNAKTCLATSLGYTIKSSASLACSVRLCEDCAGNPGICRKCRQGSRNLAGFCTPCPKGLGLTDFDRVTCQPCPNGCDFCTTPTNCVTCRKSFTPTGDGRCRQAPTCTTVSKNAAWLGYPLTAKKVSSYAKCCSLCKAHASCTRFHFSPSKMCSLFGYSRKQPGKRIRGFSASTVIRGPL